MTDRLNDLALILQRVVEEWQELERAGVTPTERTLYRELAEAVLEYVDNQ